LKLLSSFHIHIHRPQQPTQQPTGGGGGGGGMDGGREQTPPPICCPPSAVEVVLVAFLLAAPRRRPLLRSRRRSPPVVSSPHFPQLYTMREDPARARAGPGPACHVVAAGGSGPTPAPLAPPWPAAACGGRRRYEHERPLDGARVKILTTSNHAILLYPLSYSYYQLINSPRGVCLA
jgi:hypothetical protein